MSGQASASIRTKPTRIPTWIPRGWWRAPKSIRAWSASVRPGSIIITTSLIPTSSADFAAKVLDMGLSISISGIVTFKNAKDLAAVAKDIPADRLLVETDAPFLAPVPHRGKQGEPAFVADTARFLADLRGESYEQLCETTSRNFFALFNRARP